MITVDDMASLLVGGLVVGLLVPFFEELGWTGFATAELRKRHGVLATGLILGLLWGAWHVPLYPATDSGAVPLALYVPVMAFSILLPYRVLMVWVYDRTQSAHAPVDHRLPTGPPRLSGDGRGTRPDL
jgi:uncharacterized protein